MSFYKLMEDTKIEMLTNEGFYACLLNRFRIIAKEEIPTLGVTISNKGDLLMYVNMEFFSGLTNKQRVACLVHELLHVMNGHLRRGKFFKKKTANIAMDCAINQWIPNLPEGCITLQTLNEFTKKSLESKREFEYYYKALLDSTDGKGLSEDQLEEFDDHSEFYDQNKDSLSDEVKQGIENNAILGAYKEYKHRDKCQPGTHGVHMDKFLGDFEKSQNRWQELLKRYISRAISSEKEYTRKRPNRRMGYITPGTKTLYKVKPIIALDQSGSTSDDDQKTFIENIHNILGDYRDALEIVYFDTEVVKSIQANKVTDEVNTRYASGGTDFQSVVDYANDKKADLLIVFTDGDAPMPSGMRCPLIWALTGCDNNGLIGEKVFLNEKVSF